MKIARVRDRSTDYESLVRSIELAATRVKSVTDFLEQASRVFYYIGERVTVFQSGPYCYFQTNVYRVFLFLLRKKVINVEVL